MIYTVPADLMEILFFIAIATRTLACLSIHLSITQCLKEIQKRNKKERKSYGYDPGRVVSEKSSKVRQKSPQRVSE